MRNFTFLLRSFQRNRMEVYELKKEKCNMKGDMKCSAVNTVASVLAG